MFDNYGVTLYYRSVELTFEYDQSKSRSNEENHGIDFEEAQVLWRGGTVEVQVDNKTEPRFYVFGKIGGEHWAAIITYRGDRVRLISARRATKKEVNYYERHKEA